MGDRGQDGAQSFDPHGDIQQVAGEEEVVVMSQQGHNRVPTEVEESLQRDSGGIFFKKMRLHLDGAEISDFLRRQ